MSYVDPKLKYEFESLPIDLKNEILDMGINIYSLDDMIACMEMVVNRDINEQRRETYG